MYQKTVAVKVFEGANIFASCPVIKYRFEYQGIDALVTGDFALKFARLIEEGDGVSAPAFINSQDMEQGADQRLVTLFAEYSVLLQRQAGCDLHEGIIQQVGPDCWDAFIPFSNAEIGRLASLEVYKALNHALENGISEEIEKKAITHFENFRQELKNRFLELSLETPAPEFIQIAEKRGIPWKRVSDDKQFLHFGYGKHRQATNRTILQVENQISSEMANNKQLTTMLLAEAGLPVARQKIVTSRLAAEDAAKEIGFPVAIKPLYGLQGYGVSPRVEGPDQLTEALFKARQYNKPIIVEEHIEGKDYRLQVTGGKFESGILRMRAMVTGDGEHSIEQLADEINKAPWRWDSSGKLKYGIRKTDDSARIMERQGYSWDSIPDKDVDVYLQDVANSSQGGDYEDITPQVHPENVKMAERAAAAVGLQVAGVDFLTTDISKPYWEAGGAICEVNLMPAIDGIAPSDDQPLYQFEKAFDLMFPQYGADSIPSIAIIGDDQAKSGIWIKQILDIYDLQIGWKIGNEAHIDGSPLVGLRNSIDASKAILWNPAVEAAVLVDDPETLRDDGVGYGQIDCILLDEMPRYEDGSPAVNVLNLVAGLATKAILYNDDDLELSDWASCYASDVLIAVSCDDVPQQVIRNTELLSLFESLDEEEKPAFLMAVQAAIELGLPAKRTGTVHEFKVRA